MEPEMKPPPTTCRHHDNQKKKKAKIRKYMPIAPQREEVLELIDQAARSLNW
jgi:hypothetical protein